MHIGTSREREGKQFGITLGCRDQIGTLLRGILHIDIGARRDQDLCDCNMVAIRRLN